MRTDDPRGRDPHRPAPRSGAAQPQPADLQARLARIERLLTTDPRRADEEASKVLADSPGQPMALLFQGIARRLAGDPASAAEILASLCRAWPQAPLPHLQLGLALRELGDDEAAARSLRRAVEAKPDFGDAWLALADLLTKMGDAAGADQAFGMYVQHAARDPHLAGPANALRENRIAEAEALLRGQLERHPNDVAALCMLADVAARQGRIDQAESLLRRCLALAPGYRAARHNLAVVLMRQNRPLEALSEVDRLLADEPRNPDLRKLKGAIFVSLGEYVEAERVFEDLLTERADEPRLWASLGHVLRTLGKRQRSIEAYRRAAVLAPQFGEAYWNLANLKNFRFSDAELETMRAQLRGASLADEDRIHFHFAIGKALEDRGEYAESFRHYAEGNRLRRQGLKYSADGFSDLVRRSKALFTAEFFAARRGWGAAAADPIFVVGLPRSGSTLVEQILASHSAVEGTMELTHVAGLARSLSERRPGTARYPEVLASLEAGEARALGESYLEQTRVLRKRGTPYFIDKMPNNFAHLGLIHLMLPNARIIDVRRHPLACGWSLFRHLFAHGQPFSYSLEDIGRYYRDYVDLMAHFDAVLPGRVHRVIYESLVEDTETEVRRLLEHCGLPFEPACLSFHANERAVSTASSEQVRTPIFRDSLDHWRHYRAWLGPLEAQLGPLAETYPATPGIP